MDRITKIVVFIGSVGLIHCILRICEAYEKGLLQ